MSLCRVTYLSPSISLSLTLKTSILSARLSLLHHSHLKSIQTCIFLPLNTKVNVRQNVLAALFFESEWWPIWALQITNKNSIALLLKPYDRRPDLYVLARPWRRLLEEVVWLLKRWICLCFSNQLVDWRTIALLLSSGTEFSAALQMAFVTRFCVNVNKGKRVSLSLLLSVVNTCVSVSNAKGIALEEAVENRQLFACQKAKGLQWWISLWQIDPDVPFHQHILIEICFWCIVTQTSDVLYLSQNLD